MQLKNQIDIGKAIWPIGHSFLIYSVQTNVFDSVVCKFYTKTDLELIIVSTINILVTVKYF